jgi:hypothetical protein
VPGRGRDVGKLVEELVQSCLSVVDRCPLVVGEGNGGAYALRVVLGFQQERFGGVIRCAKEMARAKGGGVPGVSRLATGQFYVAGEGWRWVAG